MHICVAHPEIFELDQTSSRFEIRRLICFVWTVRSEKPGLCSVNQSFVRYECEIYALDGSKRGRLVPAMHYLFSDMGIFLRVRCETRFQRPAKATILPQPRATHVDLSTRERSPGLSTQIAFEDCSAFVDIPLFFPTEISDHSRYPSHRIVAILKNWAAAWIENPPPSRKPI